MDVLEDPGSSILSYRSQVERGVFYYVPKKSHFFMIVSKVGPEFDRFLTNSSLINGFISHNRC
jgi:hypothetical protein